MTFNEMMSSPGTYAYMGYQVKNHGDRIITVIDPRFGRTVIHQEYIQTKDELDRLISIISTSK